MVAASVGGCAACVWCVLHVHVPCACTCYMLYGVRYTRHENVDENTLASQSNAKYLHGMRLAWRMVGSHPALDTFHVPVALAHTLSLDTQKKAKRSRPQDTCCTCRGAATRYHVHPAGATHAPHPQPPGFAPRAAHASRLIALQGSNRRAPLTPEVCHTESLLHPRG